ncbi:MAG TPA: helix-turn-helix domain-containing protein [Roseiflexaceae bacterium]|jgi:transposase|nr:helix-turn-helix domain-containing protein [Roseiflexaceae bacterium]
MPNPIFVRPFTDAEQQALEQGLQSSAAFTLRRCQILLASARGETAITIARQLSCGDQTVRNAIHAFNTCGLAALHPGSTVAQHLPHTAFNAAGLAHLQVIIKRSPRTFGHQTSLWTLDLLAEVCFTEGLTARQVSGETIRATLKRLGIAWKRAKHWIRSPDPAYTSKKSGAIG